MIRNLQHQHLYPFIAKYVEKDWYRVVDYITEQNIPIRSYYDDLNACEYLELDMTQAKTLYPKDFTHWHDIRIDEAHTKRAMKDAEERKYVLSDRFTCYDYGEIMGTVSKEVIEKMRKSN